MDNNNERDTSVKGNNDNSDVSNLVADKDIAKSQNRISQEIKKDDDEIWRN